MVASGGDGIEVVILEGLLIFGTFHELRYRILFGLVRKGEWVEGIAYTSH